VVAPKKLTLTVYFKGDSAVLTSATKIALTRLARKAKTYGTASAITVIGRVKETNDKSYDARLSKQRATNVAVFLRKLGVTGTYRVIAAGISPENKPVSRRVDTTLVWNK
jgi:outer membrane protein OmpA-like peptidoglycan-associated protein